MSVTALLEGKRLVVCCGPGGGGKTTAADAIALDLAAAGADVAVLAIDPAPRLAAPAERRRTGAGEISTMALDPKGTLDELVERATSGAELKANRIYRELSSAVAQEIAGVAKLADLERTGRFDVVVLDTPPSRSALDFLLTPSRLSALLDSQALRAFIGPAAVGGRFLGLGRLSGVELLTDAATFFGLLGELMGEFRARAKRVEAMLRAPTTAFLLITSAEPDPVEEAIWLGRTLAERGLPVTAVAVNRMHPRLGSPTPASALGAVLPSGLASRVAASAEAQDSLARRDERTMSHLRRSLPSTPVLA